MSGSRVGKSLKNSIYGIVGMTITLILSFVTISAFIKILGPEANGVNYLFSGILNALNLAEMGFASAISYALYSPLASGDNEAAAALMNLFRNVYRVVAVVVACLGALCIPFLQYLIKDDISSLPFTLNELRIFFTLFLMNTVFSYVFAYKRTIITADQKSYIVTNVDYIMKIVMNIIQIVLLLITKSYYVYLIVMIVKSVLNNVIIAIIANKQYPFMLEYKSAKVLPEDKQKIFNNVKAMMLHKIGAVVIYNSGTIVISAIVGVFENNLYGNYISIAAQVSTFIGVLFTSVTASVGNLCVEESEEKQLSIFNSMNYLALWIGYFVFICFVCLYNPFIEIWLGKDMTFGMPVVIAIAFNQSIGYFRKSVLTFRDAKGLFMVDRYKPILESILGISLAIGLGKVWGVFGIIVGYTIATLIIAMPIEKWALFKQGFHIKYGRYYLFDILATMFMGGVAAGMYFLLSLLPDGIGWFVLRLVLCIVLPNIIFVVSTCWTKEFKYFLGVAKNILGKFKHKISSQKDNKKTEIKEQ